MSAKRASKSRPCSTPRRCRPVRFAPATNWPSRSASSATTVPENPTGPIEPGSAPNVAPERRGELRLLEAVVSPHEREDDAPILDDRHRLRRRRRVDPERRRERLDRLDAGRLDLDRGVETLGGLGPARDAARDLEVGRVVAVLARHERVLPRARRSEEVERLAPAHHPRLRFHLVDLEPAPFEDPPVRGLVLPEADVEPFLIAVERVRVLHDELADAEEAAARARLVADLRLEVVEDLRQLLVRLELARM